MACLRFNCIVSIFTEHTLLEVRPHGSMIIMTGQRLILDAASSSDRMTHSVHIVAVCCDIYVMYGLVVYVCVHTSSGSLTNMLSH